MTTIHINPTGNDSGTGSAGSPFRTWAKVNPLLQPGVTVRAADGTYVDKPVFGASGTSQQPIRITGSGAARIVGSLNFANRAYIHVEGLNLHSRASGWFHSNTSSDSITLRDLLLSSELTTQANFDALPYVGGLLAGKNHTFTGGKVENWYRGDAIQLDATHSLVEDVDFSKCNAQHGSLIVKGSYNVVRGKSPDNPMVIINRWDRPFEVMEFGTRGKATGNLFENIRIKQSNWDGLFPLPSIWAGGYVGGLQLAKAGGTGNIWRDFEIEDNYVAGFVATQDYRGVLHLGNFMGGAQSSFLSANFRHNRYYNVRIRNNPYNAITVTLNTAIPHDYQDNIWFNCEISGNLTALYARPDGPHVNGIKLYNSIVADKLIRGSKVYTIGEYEKAFPQQASGNTDGTTQPALRPLGRVTVAATNSTILTLDDARAISDGNKRIPGDMLQIGNQVTQVTERLSATQVRVTTPVTVAVGDAVWLERWNVQQPLPEPIPPVVEPEPTPEPVEELPPVEVPDVPSEPPPVVVTPTEVIITLRLTVEGSDNVRVQVVQA